MELINNGTGECVRGEKRRWREGGVSCAYGRSVVLDVWCFPAVAHMDSINNWKRKSGADYVTALIYSIFCSSSLNNSQPCLPLLSGSSEGLKRTHLPSTRMSCTPPPSPLPALSLSPSRALSLRSSSRPPSFLHFLTLLLLLLLLHHSFQLWMPFSLTEWSQEGKEERVGWRTSGRNGRASPSFVLFLCLFIMAVCDLVGV